MHTIWDAVVQFLGLHVEAKNLTALQISARAAFIFIVTLVMIRMGHKRSLARKTAFDSILIVLLAAILSRAINGSAPFVPTIAGAGVLVALHRLMAWLAYHSHAFGRLVKGSDDLIVLNGEVLPEPMRQNKITRRDVEEDMRLSAKTDDLQTIAEARVERSGDISFIKRK